MNRRLGVFVFVMVAAVSATVSAHIVEVKGTVIERAGDRLDVQTASGVVTVKIDGSTTVIWNRRRVEADQLKAGQRVEAQTLDDADAVLVAYLITILAPEK